MSEQIEAVRQALEYFESAIKHECMSWPAHRIHSHALAAALPALEQMAADSERLESALVANTLCQTCEGEKQITLECDACLCGEGSLGRCKCDEEHPFDCPQCDGKGFDCTPETVEIVSAARASRCASARAQEQPK